MIPRLIGMVHLGPLPGSPGFDGDLSAVIERATTDARSLEAAGFGGLMVENFGDAPFFADDVPKLTVAAMTAAVAAITEAAEIAVGVNVLRNDALAALDVAAATGAAFVRVNVLSGTMYTDQGPIVGRAAEVARHRVAVAPDVAVMADVFVKHATPPAGLTLAQATTDLAERGGADAIVVSGSATGRAPTLTTLRAVKSEAGSVPVFLGSGVTAANAARFLTVADGVIAGTSVKQRGVTTNPVSPTRAKRLVAATRQRGRGK